MIIKIDTPINKPKRIEIAMLKSKIAILKELEEYGLIEFKPENHKKISRFITDSICEVFGYGARNIVCLYDPFTMMKNGKAWMAYIIEKLQEL